MNTFISGFGKIVNNSKNVEPANQFVVVSKKDNLVHNYFFYCDAYWDSRNCLAEIILKFPKQKHDKVKYWTEYDDLIYVYMGNDIAKTFKMNQANYKIKKKARPFFVGQIFDVYEKYDQIIVQVHNIGTRFKQKIPNEFRESYINNQNVRDAFQAICEFLGVYYICPPQNAQEDGAQTPDGSVNDPETQKNLENNTKQQIKNQSQNSQNGTDNGDQSQSGTDETNNNQENQQQVANGYSQISFDANGLITFNGAEIEESPDSEKSLLQIDDKTYDNFLEEGKDIIKDVKKFLNGEIFEEIHPNYLDYNAITIEPKSAPSNPMNEINDSQNETGDGTQGSDQNSESGSQQQ